MQNLTVKNLAVMNLKQKSYRTALLMILITLSTAVLFGCFVLVSSMKNGIFSLQKRLGADLLIVPEGYEGAFEGILLNGSPNYFYMDKSIEKAILNVSGVEKVTSQFYLTSMSEGCCDFPIQLIGFDVNTDFVIKQWISERFSGEITGDVVFSGADVSIEKKTMKIFGREHPVLSKLAKSGSGMDYAIYTSMDTLKSIYQDAVARGFGFISDGDVDSKVSTILVKLSPGAKADTTSLKIRAAVPGVKIIRSQSFIDNFSKTLSSLLIFLYAIVAVFFIIAFTSLSVVFSVTVHERIKEFSILRILGANHKTLSNIILYEAGLISIAGGISGILLSIIIIFPFSRAIAEKISLPFIVPNLFSILIFASITFILVVLAGILASLKSIHKISKFEPYGGAK